MLPTVDDAMKAYSRHNFNFSYSFYVGSLITLVILRQHKFSPTRSSATTDFYSISCFVFFVFVLHVRQLNFTGRKCKVSKQTIIISNSAKLRKIVEVS